MPSPLASGHLHLSFPSHPPPWTHIPLSLFRPSDFPLGVIGIASCSRSDSMPSILAQFDAGLSDIFPQGSTFPVASNCFVFDESDGSTNLDEGDRYPNLVIIPSMMANKTVHIGTLVAGLCSHILGEFATMMESLESPLGNEYLNATLFPVLPPPSEMPKFLDIEDNPRDSLPPLPSHNSQPELIIPVGTSRAKSPLTTLKRASTGPGLVPSRHASLPVPTTRKRQNIIGAASSHGRLFKVLGDLFLLAGRLEDSAVWYTEAIALFKSPQDAVWHASALEGLSTIPVIEAWSSTHGMNGFTGDKEPWSDISNKLSQATSLYYKSTPSSEPETTYSLLAHLYTQSILRHTSLLFAVWTAKGWGPLAFSTMLHPGANLYLDSFMSAGADSSAATVTVTTNGSNSRTTFADLERLTTITGIPRVLIASTLAQVHGPWLLHLGPRERVNVLQTVAGIYGAIGYPRKEAYILRELLGSVMDLLVCGREEGSSIRSSSTGLGIRGVALGPMNKGTVSVRENESVEGNESVLAIVKHVCRVHGIDLEAVRLIDFGAKVDYPRPVDSGNADNNTDSLVEQEDDFPELSQEPFGWPELQVGIVREAIAVAEALPDYPSVAQFSLSSLKTLHLVMSHNDQQQLYNTAGRALATAKRRGVRRTVDYWSGQPIVSIEVLALPLVCLPAENPISALSQGRSRGNPALAGLTDPFLYNPRKSIAGQGRIILVQDEPFEVVVTLRNPFVFDLQLQSLALSISGVPFESEAIAVVVPANTYHPVTVSGKASEPGVLRIRGCVVQAPDGVPREFVLPLSTEEKEVMRLRRRSAIDSEAGRSKRSGLESRPWEKDSKRMSRQTGSSSSKRSVHYLECKVVPSQPLLRIRRTSLTHGAVMLYNGETSAIRITLENVSSLPIDFLRLTFDDSTIAPAQQALAEGELSVFETYEAEYDLIHRPVFTWDGNRGEQRISPGEKAVIIVKCFGKVGCTTGAINVSYAYIHRQQTVPKEPSDVFHTRQLSHPVLVTVYHMLECHAMDILPYSSTTTFASPDSSEVGEESPMVKARKTLFNVGNVADWCLFSIDVRNTYGLPFEVTFERRQSGGENESTTTLVPPGSTSRLILPIKKFSLSEGYISRPIPTLSDRQFIVAKSSLTSAEEKAQRELFWYREELLRIVCGRWKENGGARTGELSLRQQRMTLPMLEALRTETARIDMSLFHYDANHTPREVPVDPSGGKFLPQPNEFVYLRTRVTNLSPSELILTLNLYLEPSQHVIHQGLLLDIPIGRLKQGEAHETETPIAFVSGGSFDFHADVCALDQIRDTNQVGKGHLRAMVSAAAA
ncbi:hypothetical protein AcW1_005748 [Taiwanofungus camphoratus]|nr:hypothetical protein AcW2_004511 [Antrodia cinnamomea]KAI0934125.1 hypothetical protein AcV5_006074 [Antrodia cinnamomea]KAI0950578.1 hypothetical protein AcV7_008998 [Antrodia cinnamomea]KAI0957320.1 hypothetical protein AcW1_005748 [Antrodia cinnamomea]